MPVSLRRSIDHALVIAIAIAMFLLSAFAGSAQADDFVNTCQVGVEVTDASGFDIFQLPDCTASVAVPSMAARLQILLGIVLVLVGVTWQLRTRLKSREPEGG